MKISIITPTFNSGTYIERAIKSVLNQDYENFEHIIIDGKSSDCTISILKKYTHLKWISEKDFGQSDAMNKGFNLSSGDIIVYLNADDELEKNVFSSVVNKFKNSDTDVLIGNGRIMRNNIVEKEWNSTISFNKLLLFDLYDWPYNPFSYYCKRKVHENIKFNINNHYTMDYEFLLQVYRKYKLSHIDLILGTFHVCELNKTSTIDSREEIYNTLKRYSKENKNFYFEYYRFLRDFDRYKKRISQIFNFN